MRPQIVDKKNHELMLGEAKLKEDGIIFNMTPSPGATSSLSIAMQDTIEVCRHLGKIFDEQKHKEEIDTMSFRME
jgi:malate dehydrogenase (quinone)